MKQKLHILFLLMALLPWSIMASAEELDFNDGILNYSCNTDTRKATCKGFVYTHRYDKSVTIPSSVTYNGVKYTVTTIEKSAFKNHTDLVSISLSEDIVDISYAFEGCTGLKDIHIPDGVKYIDGTFYGCTGLVSINIPSSTNCSMYQTFEGCAGLTSIKIPNGVMSLDCTFAGCTGLTSVEIPNGVTSLYNTFKGCTGLTSVEIPNSVRELRGTFAGCTGLKSIEIPNEVWYLSDAFAGCTGLTSVEIPNSVTELSGTFAGCTGLTSVEIPNGVTSLYETFKGCTDLTSINIPNGATDLRVAFAGCTGLKSVEIPNSVTELSGTFADCTGLASVNIPDGVKDISGTFMNCTSLTSINIPDGVINMNKAFMGCTKLKSIKIPDGVTDIHNAFIDCASLTSVNIPNGIEDIGNTFYGCKKLTSIKIPNSITCIGSAAFMGCINLTSIEFPANIESIKHEAFSGCSSLTSLDIPKGLNSIEFETFMGCKNLKTLRLHSETAPIFKKFYYSGSTSRPNDLCEEELYKQIILITPKGATGYDTGVWAKFNRSNKANLSDDVRLMDDDEYYPGYLTYTRHNLTPATYATFCLPFSIDLSDVADKLDAVYTTNGTALYKPNGKLVLMLKKIGMSESIPAGQAFVGKLNSTATEVTFANNAIITTDENTMQNPEPQKLEVYNWNGTSGLLTENTDISVSYGGALTTMTGKGNNYETFNSNGTFGPTAGGTVKAFRAYVVKNDATTINKVRSISLGIESETTGVNIITASPTEHTDNAIYSIDGTLINTVGNIESLPSGIYIKNHKKIIIK